MRKIRPATATERTAIASAIADLRQARDKLAAAHAPQATRAVRRALKSAEGAARHVRHRIQRSEA